jgi:serine/threonine protein kinase
MNATLERGALLHKRYRIVEILGQGGMGSVYHAIDENLGVDVAVKENLFTTDEYARQFRFEAVLLANLRHPNLPRVTDHFVVGEQGQYLVMDFIEGEDLRQRMERAGPISEQDAVLIGAAMCDALQFLHTRKPAIIHRDVKPGNVRISPDGHVYLVDFGLAKLIKGGQATTTGARAMTPGYSPPEQYGTARTDPRTDIYSLGATLYAALCGIIPEDGLARAMDNVSLTPLRERSPRVSRKLAAAIEKALAVRPEDRFQSADEFKQALASSSGRTQRLEGEIVVTPPPESARPVTKSKSEAMAREKPSTGKRTPTVPPLSPPRKRNWSKGCWIFFSFFLLTLLLGVLAVVVFWSPISQALPTYFGRPASPAAPETPSVQPTATLAVPLPSGTSPVTPSPARTVTSSWTPRPTQTPSLTLTPTPTPLPSPTLLGGGYGQIAFASNRAGLPQIFVMNSDGSSQTQVTNLPDGACQPDWSPDGTQIVFTTPCADRLEQYPGSHLAFVNADGSGLTVLPSADGGDFDPAWSPDGGRIAFTSLRDGSPQIYVYSFGDSSVTRLTQSASDLLFPEWSRQPSWSPDGTQIAYTAKRLEVMQIWTMTASGGDHVQLVRSGSALWDFLPHWSSDGKTILFSQTSGAQALGWLMVFRVGEQQSEDAVQFRNGGYATDAEFSPDRRWVIFESREEGASNYDIYRITADGRDRTRLTASARLNFDPAWRVIGTP